ncbi:MAG TPA: hypothetical protein VGR78_16965 [Verrucomicrobiae bacterium]|nr:hypothetical protein [Verrucomicrobiae bacterium]
MPLGEARVLMALGERHLWGREFMVQSESVVDLVGRSGRSAYDCEFVALARDLGLRLLTTDEPVLEPV